jgi:D-glycero-D-manno-heptose 1,7-bisphosphate phosphatase
MHIRQAAILCGGLGSRLGALTAETPKPLLPVAGRPFLQTLIQEITRYGVTRFLLLAAFRSEQIERFARELPAALGRDIVVEVAIEPDRAGTGGALFHAREALDEAFYLFNGDSILDTPLQDLADLLDDPEALGAMALRRLPEAGRYGVTVLEGDKLVQFGGAQTAPGPVLINGGVAVFRREIIDRLAPNGSLEQDLLPDLAREGRLRGLAVDGFFLDIGIPEDYERAQTEVPGFQRRPAVFFDRDGVLNVDHGHVGTPERFEWTEGALDAIALANARGYYVFIVTNQAGIAKGYYSLEDYKVLSRHIHERVAEHGGRIDDERFCPDHPEGVVEAYRRVSDWRKPAPGMILDLLDKWPVDLARSLMIGDNETDMAAAQAAGLKGHLFTGGRLDAFLIDVLDHTPN